MQEWTFQSLQGLILTKKVFEYVAEPTLFQSLQGLILTRVLGLFPPLHIMSFNPSKV